MLLFSDLFTLELSEPFGLHQSPMLESSELMSLDAHADNTFRLTRTVALVGIMGAGKTSVGKRLSAFLKVSFFDSDHEIEKAAGMQVKEIFESFGEPYFRDGEARVVARLLAGAPCVLATGGGVFVREQNRDNISERGVSVWLDAKLDTLWDRVKDRTTRPLLQQPNPKQVLSDLLDARRAHYAQAQVRVISDAGISHDMMVRRILTAIQKDDQKHPERTPTLVKVTP